MPKAISYIRFSSAKQTHGNSLERQKNLINSWLSKHPDVKLSDMKFQDLGISGYKGNHLEHGFGKLLVAIKNNYINAGDYLLVEDIDRLGRMEATDLVPKLFEILKEGVIIETLGDGQTYTKESMNHSQLYVLAGKVQQAYEKSDTLSKRIKASWKAKRADAHKGLGVNRKSFWYITKDENGKFTQITPKNKALITKIFTMFINGSSLNSIIDFLKEHDPEVFQQYSPTGLKKMLTNKTAIGYWGDIPNVYEPAIEESLFYSVQAEFKKRTGTKVQGTKTNHIMSGLVACARCGKNYAIRNQKHSATVMYCANSNKKNCDNTTVLPLSVLNEFRMRTQIPFIKKIINSSSEIDNQKSLVALEGKISTVTDSIENLMDLVESGSKSATKRVIKLEAELEELELEHNGLVANESSSIDIDSLMEAGLNMAEDPIEFNRMLKRVNYKIIADHKTIKLGSTHMEYIKFVRNGSEANSYQVSCHGQTEYIARLKDQSKTQIEQANALIKQLNKKAQPLPT